MKLLFVLLTLVCLFLLSHLIFIKRELRNISEEMRANRENSYNKQIRIQLFDRDLTELTKECNYNLDYQAECKRKAIHQEQVLKQSVSDIAHDLRTPLTVVKGNLQLLKQEIALIKEDVPYISTIEEKTKIINYTKTCDKQSDKLNYAEIFDKQTDNLNYTEICDKQSDKLNYAKISD